MSKKDFKPLIKAIKDATCNEHFYYNAHGNGCTTFKSKCPQCTIDRLTRELAEAKSALQKYEGAVEVEGKAISGIISGNLIMLNGEEKAGPFVGYDDVTVWVKRREG